MSETGDYTFRKFILDEMKAREIKSARQFALLIGVDPTTVSRSIDANNPSTPGLDYILKVAEFTKKDVGALVALAFPEVAQKTALSPDSVIMAQRFEELPQNLKEAILALMRGQVA